jgi:hypothetical protein
MFTSAATASSSFSAATPAQDFSCRGLGVGVHRGGTGYDHPHHQQSGKGAGARRLPCCRGTGAYEAQIWWFQQGQPHAWQGLWSSEEGRGAGQLRQDEGEGRGGEGQGRWYWWAQDSPWLLMAGGHMRTPLRGLRKPLHFEDYGNRC